MIMIHSLHKTMTAENVFKDSKSSALNPSSPWVVIRINQIEISHHFQFIISMSTTNSIMAALFR